MYEMVIAIYIYQLFKRWFAIMTKKIYDAEFTGLWGTGDQQAMTRRASGIGLMFTRRINGELAKL